MSKIKPRARPFFTIVRAGQQMIDLPGIGIGALVGESLSTLLNEAQADGFLPGSAEIDLAV